MSAAADPSEAALPALLADAGVRAAVAPGIPDAGSMASDAGLDGGVHDAGADGGADGGADAGDDELTQEDAEEDAELAEEDGTQDGAGDTRGETLRHVIRAANFQRNRGNLQEAESHYMRALRLDRDNPRALAGLARLNMARGNAGAAVRWARRLVATGSQNPANHVLLGDALERSGNHRAAVQSWRRALALSPGLRSAQQRLNR